MLGRMGRVSSLAPGSSTFEVHIDFNSVVSVVIWIMQRADASERRIQLTQLMKVVKFLLLPNECYHAGMEKQFEWKSTAKEACSCCSKCRGEVRTFTKRVHKGGLMSLLTQKVHGNPNLTVSNFVKAVKQAIKLIFHQDDAPPNGQESQIHAVCLPMVAAGMISFKVKDQTKLGSEKVSKADLSVFCPNMEVKVGDCMLWVVGYQSDECWEGFNTY